MGLLTDFVIAGEDEAAAIAAAVRPVELWPTLECKGVEMVKLSTLVAAATGRPADDELQEAFELAAGDEAEGPWVLRIPGEIVRLLAGIPAAELGAVAARWAESDELRLDGWSASDAADLVARLQAHAQQALASGSSLFLWISL